MTGVGGLCPVLRLQYSVARLPLRIVDDIVVSRLPAHSPPRVAYRHPLLVLDRAACRLLDYPAARESAEALGEALIVDRYSCDDTELAAVVALGRSYRRRRHPHFPPGR